MQQVSKLGELVREEPGFVIKKSGLAIGSKVTRMIAGSFSRMRYRMFASKRTERKNAIFRSVTLDFAATEKIPPSCEITFLGDEFYLRLLKNISDTLRFKLDKKVYLSPFNERDVDVFYDKVFAILKEYLQSCRDSILVPVLEDFWAVEHYEELVQKDPRELNNESFNKPLRERMTAALVSNGLRYDFRRDPDFATKWLSERSHLEQNCKSKKLMVSKTN